MEEDILVSICCITYNQENYIRDALEGFIAQDTNFKYEILIHDDNSTDKTKDIIKEYELKYPNLIKPIYQNENQYSKGKKITAEYNFPRVKGKYIAMCEGDDYWIDKNKLQMQVDFLEKNDDFSLVVHPSIYFNQENNKKSKRNYLNRDTVLDIKSFLNEYYKIIPRVLFQTSSFVFRSDDIRKLLNEKIDFYFKCNIGDIPLVLYLATQGKIYFINKDMSVYRQNSIGSWTIKQRDNKTYLKHLTNMKEMYQLFNEYTEEHYEYIINKFINSIDFDINLNSGNYKKIISKEYKRLFKMLDLKTRIYIVMNLYFPKLIEIYKLIKEKKNAKK